MGPKRVRPTPESPQYNVPEAERRIDENSGMTDSLILAAPESSSSSSSSSSSTSEGIIAVDLNPIPLELASHLTPNQLLVDEGDGDSEIIQAGNVVLDDVLRIKDS